MERIELFDNYINNQLSDAQRSEFDDRLKNDEEFASEFKVYLMTVDGICREAHQDDIDFGMAMKNLTKEQLREIIGPRHETERTVADIIPAARRARAAQSPAADKVDKTKTMKIKPWMWQAASIAAVVVIAFSAVLRVERNSREAVDNAIYACADISADLARSGGETINVASMTDDELENEIPALVKLYKTASTTDEVADNGYTLAMVYLKLHERDKAAETLNQLISRFDGNEDYADSVNKWKSILNLIK